MIPNSYSSREEDVRARLNIVQFISHGAGSSTKINYVHAVPEAWITVMRRQRSAGMGGGAEHMYKKKAVGIRLCE